MKKDPKKRGAGIPISPEERHRMIAEAAYYKAVNRGPGNTDPQADWYAAEAEIDAKLLESSQDAGRAPSPSRRPRKSSAAPRMHKT